MTFFLRRVIYLLDFYILLPEFINLGKQTIDRVEQFINEMRNNGENFLGDFDVKRSNAKIESHILR